MALKQELPSEIVNTPIRKRVTDLDHAGGDTGAMQVFASLADGNVVLDGPVGCHVMPAVAVINYTDSIPYLQNVTCSELSENEVTIAGTLGALKEKVGRANVPGRQVFIVSTPMSELIGATWTTLDENVLGSPLFFDAHSLDDDEWHARDRALLFLWQNRAHFVEPAAAPATRAGEAVSDAVAAGETPTAAALRARDRDAAAAIPGDGDALAGAPSVNIVGPTYGCFNSYSDLHEMKRMLAGMGVAINLVYPFESSSWQTSRLLDARATIVMYREFGISLAREVGLPVFHAPFGLEETTAFVHALGEALGVEAQAAAFVEREKRTTLAAWHDIWRSTHSDFFANSPIAIVAPPTYKDALERYLGGELGLPIAYSAYRTGPESAPSESVRAALRDASPSPMLIFGSINERMIVAQEKLPSRFYQASFPGAVVRRATGTPFVGYAGAVWLLQTVCEVLFDTLFANLPTSAVPPHRAERPTAEIMRDAPAAVDAGKGQNSVVGWTDDAKALAERTVKRAPFFVRVSITKKLRGEAERIARERGCDVDVAIVESVTAAYAPNR